MLLIFNPELWKATLVLWWGFLQVKSGTSYFFSNRIRKTSKPTLVFLIWKKSSQHWISFFFVSVGPETDGPILIKNSVFWVQLMSDVHTKSQIFEMKGSEHLDRDYKKFFWDERITKQTNLSLPKLSCIDFSKQVTPAPKFNSLDITILFLTI